MPLKMLCDVCGEAYERYEPLHVEVRTPHSASLKRATIQVEVQHVAHMESTEYAYVCRQCVLRAVSALVNGVKA